MIQARAGDLIQGLVSPGNNERLLFARRLAEAKGYDVKTEAGREGHEGVSAQHPGPRNWRAGQLRKDTRIGAHARRSERGIRRALEAFP